MLILIGLVASLTLGPGASARELTSGGGPWLQPPVVADPLLRLADERPKKRVWRLKLLKKIEEEPKEDAEMKKSDFWEETSGSQHGGPGGNNGSGNGGGDDHGDHDDHGSGGDHGGESHRD